MVLWDVTPEDGGSEILTNVAIFVPYYKVTIFRHSGGHLATRPEMEEERKNPIIRYVCV
jgi:hypothetical protein